MQDRKRTPGVIRILASQTGREGGIIVQEYPPGAPGTHRCVVKKVELVGFNREADCLKYCREKYRLEWTPTYKDK